VTLGEAKAHCRVDSTADDAYLASLIAMAREYVEDYIDRTLVATQWVMRLDRFPTSGIAPVELPRPPMIASGTATAVSVTFTAEAGATGTWSTAEYRVDRHATPGTVQPIYGGTYPAHRHDDNALSVTWWAGYGFDGASVPQRAKNAILLIVGEWYDKRSTATIPEAAKQLLDSIKWGNYR
jgi:uncharacterized phiE125 gp8 family phage protein